jgi:hypothetical protein
MSVRRRYEILLPLQFNDGGAVPEALLWQTVEELESQFGAVSRDTQVVRGIWEHEGTVYRDNNTRLVLDVEDSQENRAFFTTLKETRGKTIRAARHLDNELPCGYRLGQRNKRLEQAAHGPEARNNWASRPCGNTLAK